MPFLEARLAASNLCSGNRGTAMHVFGYAVLMVPRGPGSERQGHPVLPQPGLSKPAARTRRAFAPVGTGRIACPYTPSSTCQGGQTANGTIGSCPSSRTVSLARGHPVPWCGARPMHPAHLRVNATATLLPAVAQLVAVANPVPARCPAYLFRLVRYPWPQAPCQSYAMAHLVLARAPAGYRRQHRRPRRGNTEGRASPPSSTDRQLDSRRK
jgi:hypothetical protein